MSETSSAKAPLVIPLANHDAIIAALVLCACIGDDNTAVVMVKGYGGCFGEADFGHYTGICLADYDLDDILTDESWFDDYTHPELWLRLDRALAWIDAHQRPHRKRVTRRRP